MLIDFHPRTSEWLVTHTGNSYATGWNYFFKYVIATPTNLTASGIIIQYWRPEINIALWITVFGVAIIFINASFQGVVLKLDQALTLYL